MGRYYHGDIEGKFWFAIQSSMAAERFGGEALEPSHVQFYFGSENLDEVNAEIKRIEDILGDKKATIDDFFEKNKSYRDEMLEEIGISISDLKEYADLGLGIKIRDCIVREGQCSFDAEL